VPRRSGRADLNAAKARRWALRYAEAEVAWQAHLSRKAQLLARLEAWETGVARRARRRTMVCPTCAGTGNLPDTGMLCPTCGGKGRVA
jgi:hypothetical protein